LTRELANLVCRNIVALPLGRCEKIRTVIYKPLTIRIISFQNNRKWRTYCAHKLTNDGNFSVTRNDLAGPIAAAFLLLQQNPSPLFLFLSFPSSPLPSPPLSSPTASGRGPAAKRILVHFELKKSKHLVATIVLIFLRTN